ncbi:hypothetical protein HMPREF2532_00157 [Bacteroides ovatus]|nr:hypothetical protein HMPREF2532_00157 [Bacteroides ovatus]
MKHNWSFFIGGCSGIHLFCSLLHGFELIHFGMVLKQMIL